MDPESDKYHVPAARLLRIVRLVQYLFPAGFLVAGLFLISASFNALSLSGRAASWPGTPGVITRDTCEPVNLAAADGGGIHYVNRLAYAYTVNGRQYEGTREKFGIPVAVNRCGTGRFKGQPVSVFYDPRNPANSVLLPTERDGIVFGFACGAGFVLFALVVYGLLRRRSMAPQ